MIDTSSPVSESIVQLPDRNNDLFPETQHIPNIMDNEGSLIEPSDFLKECPLWLRPSRIFQVYWSALTLAFYSHKIGKARCLGKDYPLGVVSEFSLPDIFSIIRHPDVFMETANSLTTEQYQENEDLGYARKLLNWWWVECRGDDLEHLRGQTDYWKNIYQKRQRGLNRSAIIVSLFGHANKAG